MKTLYYDVWFHEGGTHSILSNDDPKIYGGWKLQAVSPVVEAKLISYASMALVAGIYDTCTNDRGVDGKAVYVNVDEDHNFIEFDR